ncbi:MAG TPA: sensor domain-containing diguanylate cyclase [Candidatus Rifleibacterium sp.]|nr:sensor domain-containing diguanylate cyclase [Candidatus Rifleibacterium sp.]
MNIFRNFSIKIRLLITFLLVSLLPVVIFIYVQYSGVAITNATAFFIGVIAVVNAMITSFLVAASIVAPIDMILHALQIFQTKKSAASVTDNGQDEVAEVSFELNRIFSEWNQEIVAIGKKQFQLDKEQEKNQVQISLNEQQLASTRSLLKVAQTLNTTFDFQSNLKAILDEAVAAMNVQWASLLLINREKHEMTVACVRGIEKSLLDDLTEEEYPSIRLKPHEGLAGQVIKDGLPLIANKGFKDPRFKQFSEFKSKDEKVASLLCAPIVSSDGVVLGVMNLINRIVPPVFRNEDLPYVKDLCMLASLIIERNRMYSNLFVDELTGLSAHNVWKGYFAEESARAVRYAQTLSLVILDVDNFKKIATDTNAEFATQLNGVCGKVIARTLRDTDTASSVQERFFLLLPNTDLAGAVYLTGRIKEAIEKETLEFDGRRMSITVSAGIASYPETVPDVKNLMKASIQAVSQAHDAGGNRANIHKSDKAN